MINDEKPATLLRAENLIADRTRLGMPRKVAKLKGFIVSRGTARAYTNCLSSYFEWLQLNEIAVEEQDHKKHVVNFLDELSESISQSFLNQHCQAFKVIFKIHSLPRITAIKQNEYFKRSYSWQEVKEIIKFQNESNAIATLIAYSCGIRAHELVTLRLASEAARSKSRPWRSDLFSGIADCEIYVVTGKGGLRRFVALPKYLSALLESRRVEEISVVDRGIPYKKIYEVSFGQRFSNSFSKASKKALGFSYGAHGLRHSYVKRRINKLLDLNFHFSEAMLILSQEVGHFRPLITLCYLR
jgi:integrase